MYKENFKTTFLKGFSFTIGILAALSLLTVVILSLWLLLHPKLSNLQTHLLSFDNSKKLSQVEINILQSALAKGLVIGPQDIVSQLTAFYDTIISFLIGVIALASLFGYIFIKVKTSQEVEKMITEEFANFTESSGFKQTLNTIISQSDAMIEISEIADDLSSRITIDDVSIPSPQQPTEADSGAK